VQPPTDRRRARRPDDGADDRLPRRLQRGRHAPRARTRMTLDEARWWAMRGAQSLRPATYRCPLCDSTLHAMSDHMLIAPEGDASRRRHAHTACVVPARETGRLPTYDDWRGTQPRGPGVLTRLWRRGGRAG